MYEAHSLFFTYSLEVKNDAYQFFEFRVGYGSLTTGISFGGSNMYLKPRDMAKVGQMLLQHGKWQGRQIVDSAWIAEAVKIQVQETGYGYYFWIFSDMRTYSALGHGGQSITVAPDRNLVVVVTAWPYMTDTGWLRDNFEGTLLKEVLAACN